MTQTGPLSPDLAIVVPVFDESGNATRLAREIATAFAGRNFELLFIDDASRDDTRAQLLALKAEIPQLRVLSHETNAGQSRALRSGILQARSPVIVTMDGDGQNNPRDALVLVDALLAGSDRLGLVGGERQKRQDTAAKRIASRLANAIRGRLLADQAKDTGCGLKAMRREAFLRLPYFDHIHRYLPALMLREGFEVQFRPVSHRARSSGTSKYTNFGRLVAALSDLLGVIWLNTRARRPGSITEH